MLWSEHEGGDAADYQTSVLRAFYRSPEIHGTGLRHECRHHVVLFTGEVPEPMLI